MGIQQRPHQRRRPRKRSLQNQLRALRTLCHVLRTNELPEHVPNHDGYHLPRSHSNGGCSNLHGRHPHRYPYRPPSPPKNSTPNTGQTRGTRSIPQTREVHVRSTRNRIPGVDNRRRKSTHGPSKSPRSRRLETPKEPQGTTRLDGLHQFLQNIHRRILKNRTSPERTYKEGDPMGMDRRKRRSFSEAKRAYLRRTSTPHAKIGETLRTGSGRVKLRDRGNAKPERRTRTVAPSSLLLHHPLRNRAELRHLRQRTISSRKITPSLEDVPRRSPTSNSHPHRPLKPPVLEGAWKN